jgi:predicted membrane protein
MLLAQVLFMRFNIVIGGQLISKSERGFVDYQWTLWGHEGILASAIVFSMPFIAFFIISRFIPVLGGSIQKE